MRYEVRPDGSLANGKVFFDATAEPGEDAWDGMKVGPTGRPLSLRTWRALDNFS